MKHILKPALSLFIIAAISTVLLGLVRDVTLAPIENQRKKTLEATMKAVLNDASEFREISAEKTGSIVRIFEGHSGNTLIGYVIELSPAGYSGSINMMTGISRVRNEVTGMRVFRHGETPGLGALAVKESFYRKYEGRKPVRLNVVRASPGENDIEAITSATITSKAITGAVNEAIEWYNFREADMAANGASRGAGTR